MPGVACHEVVDGGSGERRLDDKQVRYAGFGFLIEADFAVVVGDCALDALGGDLGVVEQVYQALGVAGGLAHLRGWVLQVVDFCGTGGDEWFGDGEGFLVSGVEAFREGAGEFEVLPLVFAHGHDFRPVEENVGGHEHGVGVEPGGGAVGALFGGFILELGHAAGLAEAGEAGEDPRELGVFRHVGLHEEGGFIRVDAEC